MSPPLCAKCGAELPDPMAPAVITCPSCDAKSEARTGVADYEPLPAGLRERNAAILGVSPYPEQASPMTIAVNAAREQERRRALRIIGEVRERWSGEPSAEIARAICDALSAEIEGQE